MTKKEFIKLADYVRGHAPYCEPFTDKQVEHLANFCHASNSAFKRQVWLDYIVRKIDEHGRIIK